MKFLSLVFLMSFSLNALATPPVVYSRPDSTPPGPSNSLRFLAKQDNVSAEACSLIRREIDETKLEVWRSRGLNIVGAFDFQSYFNSVMKIRVNNCYINFNSDQNILMEYYNRDRGAQYSDETCAEKAQNLLIDNVDIIAVRSEYKPRIIARRNICDIYYVKIVN